MSEEIKKAFERLRHAYESNDLFNLYEAAQHLRQLLAEVVGADLARQDYETYNAGD